MGITASISNLTLSHIGYIQNRLHGQQVHITQKLLFLIGETHTTSRHALGKAIHDFFHNSLLQLYLFIAGLSQLYQTLLTLFHSFHISQA